jgi:DNA-binding NarL/FixJ family response regulator
LDHRIAGNRRPGDICALRFSIKRGAMQNSEQDWHSLLTPRELEVARLVARGLSNKEISQILGTSPGTVKVQVHWVLQKLGVSKRGDLVLQRRV